MKNTAVLFSLAALALACAGLVLTLLAYAAFFLFVQGIGASAYPSLDAAALSIGDAQQTLSYSADVAGVAPGAIANLTIAVSSYADATDGIGNLLSSIAQNPLLSLDTQLSSSVSQLRTASSALRGASQSLNSSSGSAASAVASLRKASSDMNEARNSVLQAKGSFSSALGMLNIAGFLLALVAVALFSSTGMLSVSVLLSHYPDLFSKKAEGVEEAGKQQQSRN